jgi:hypothetical protein
LTEFGKLLDLTGHIDKRDCIGRGSFGDVHKAEITLVEDSIARRVPTLVVKVMRVNGDEGSAEFAELRYKVGRF